MTNAELVQLNKSIGMMIEAKIKLSTKDAFKMAELLQQVEKHLSILNDTLAIGADSQEILKDEIEFAFSYKFSASVFGPNVEPVMFYGFLPFIKEDE